MTNDELGLVEKLKILQGDRTQQEFADELGIDQSILSRLYSGEISLGLKTAKAIVAKYSCLSKDVTGFLFDSNMHIDNVDNASNIPTNTNNEEAAG